MVDITTCRQTRGRAQADHPVYVFSPNRHEDSTLVIPLASTSGVLDAILGESLSEPLHLVRVGGVWFEPEVARGCEHL